MPLARIEVRKRRPPQEVAAILAAVHTALRAILAVPARDRHLRYVEHAPEHFAAPPDASDDYTLVELTVFPGRPPAVKAALYRAIVANLGALGIAAADVLIVVHEPPLANWGIRGGIPASEVELGFALDPSALAPGSR